MTARRETGTAMAIVFIELSSVSLCFNLTVVIGDEVLAIFDEVFVLTKRKKKIISQFFLTWYYQNCS
jgi:hypothetical protein